MPILHFVVPANAFLLLNILLQTLYCQVTTDSLAPVSSISLSAPAQHQDSVNLAIGRASGSLEAWSWNISGNKIQKIHACDAHDQVVKFHFTLVCLHLDKRKKISNITIGDRSVMGFSWALFIQLQSGVFVSSLHFVINSDFVFK